VKKLKKQKGFHIPIDVAFPQTVEEVHNLHENQLPWIIANAGSSSWNELSFEMQIEINEAVTAATTTQRTMIPFSDHHLTLTNLQIAEEKSLVLIAEQSFYDQTLLLKLSPDSIHILKKRLDKKHHRFLDLNTVDVSKLSKEKVKHYNKEFRQWSWDTLKQEQQEAFNKAFEAQGLTIYITKEPTA